MGFVGGLIRRRHIQTGNFGGFVTLRSRGLAFMAEIIPFRPKSAIAEEDETIDLYTAVDAAIRDLKEISDRWGEEAARLQAEECRRMLERAFAAAY